MASRTSPGFEPRVLRSPVTGCRSDKGGSWFAALIWRRRTADRRQGAAAGQRTGGREVRTGLTAVNGTYSEPGRAGKGASGSWRTGWWTGRQFPGRTSIHAGLDRHPFRQHARQHEPLGPLLNTSPSKSPSNSSRCAAMSFWATNWSSLLTAILFGILNQALSPVDSA